MMFSVNEVKVLYLAFFRYKTIWAGKPYSLFSPKEQIDLIHFIMLCDHMGADYNIIIEKINSYFPPDKLIGQYEYSHFEYTGC
jgi:hypothetical protein